jgi:hypothetical protein
MQLGFHPASAGWHQRTGRPMPHLLAERLSTVRHRVDFGFRAWNPGVEIQAFACGLFFQVEYRG